MYCTSVCECESASGQTVPGRLTGPVAVDFVDFILPSSLQFFLSRLAGGRA